MLRRAREAAGMHVAALAVALKVPVAKLEALENDQFELMPDMVFVRALASSICRVLKVDPQPILVRLPQTVAPRLMGDVDGINAPFRAPSDAAPPGWRAYARQPVFLIVLALLVGAAVLMVLPNTRSDDKPLVSRTSVDSNLVVAAGASAPVQTTSVAFVSAPAEPAVVPATLAGSAPVQPAAAPASTAVTANLSAPTAATTPPVQAVIPVVVAPAASIAASGLVVVRAKSESWVEITDAKGGVALRKVLGAGEVAGAQGVVPLQVTIGRVDATEVQVRGQPFDLGPVSRNNVARFTVK
jgi:cytoskeleton protein RodZ